MSQSSRVTSIRPASMAIGGWMTVLAVLTALVAVAPLRAQDTDARWVPFLGCWQAVGAEEDGGLFCFTPGDGGVQLANWVDGDVASTETLAADGVRRSVASDGCEGWESIEFSQDGRRAFTTTEFLCGGGEARSGTGVMAFIAPNRWADVRALQVGGETIAWVQEYQLVGVDRMAEEGVPDPAAGRSLAVRSARAAASAAITFDDVLEASERMDDKAVETWVVVQGDELDPSADDLIRLADAGVSDQVIDAVVAVSNPDRFLAQATGPIEEVEQPQRPRTYRGYMAFNPFFGPRWGAGYGYYRPYLGYSPYYYGYDPFYSGYGYGYGGWGYPGGYYGYGYYGGGGYVIIDRRGDGGGRAINGRGYTRGSTGSGGRIAQPRSGSSQPSLSRGGSGSGSSAGSSGSGGSTRRAVRRPGGGSSSLSSAPVRRPAPRPSISRPSAASRPAARPVRSGASSSRPSASSRPSGSSRSGASRPARRRPGG